MADIAKVKIGKRIYSVKDEEARRQISSEAAARTSADAALKASIEAEETRAKGVEQSLQKSINNEATTREQANETLDGKISANTEAITAERIRAEGIEQNLNSKIDVNAAAIATEKTRAEGAEHDLDTQIELERTGRIQATSILSRGIAEIEEKIPSEASRSNKLTDKDFVNSSIATATATFKGTYNSLAELEAVAADSNDYGFVIATDADGNTLYKRYKYDGTNWVWEYDLNNSSFTAAQWAAIQSGITNGHVSRINNLGQLAFQDYAIGGMTPSGTNAPSAITLQGGGKARLKTKTLPVVSVPTGWAEQTSKVSKITDWNPGTMFTAQVNGETLTLTPGATPQLTYQDLSALIALNVRVYATVPRVESGAPITIATGAVGEDGTGAEVVTELPTGGTAAAQVFTGDFADITVNAPNY